MPCRREASAENSRRVRARKRSGVDFKAYLPRWVSAALTGSPIGVLVIRDGSPELALSPGILRDRDLSAACSLLLEQVSHRCLASL